MGGGGALPYVYWVCAALRSSPFFTLPLHIPTKMWGKRLPSPPPPDEVIPALEDLFEDQDESFFTSKRCNTDGRSVWTAGETMLENKSYLVKVFMNFSADPRMLIIWPYLSDLSYVMHSKNTRIELDQERVHWGQTPFRVNDGPEISQPGAEYDRELGQSDPIICEVCGKLTDFRVIDPEWGLSPMAHVRVKCDPGVFRVCM